MNNSIDDSMEYRSKLLLDVIFPIGISVGILVNIAAILFWIFGPKSRSLCCATYFAANAVADFLTLSIVGLWTIICSVQFNENCLYVDVTCKIQIYLNGVLFQITNWISSALTVERALTIMFPLRFKSHDMCKNSKYAITLIVVLALVGILTSIYGYEHVEGTIFCKYREDFNFKSLFFIEVSVRTILPFTVIVVFNCCTIATLCKQRRNSVSANQDRYVNTFTKLTLFTGLSFVVSNTPGVVYAIWIIRGIWLSWNEFFLLIDLTYTMCYLNCLMNPIICFVICKSIIKDMKTFGQRLLLVFSCGEHGITT